MLVNIRINPDNSLVSIFDLFDCEKRKIIRIYEKRIITIYQQCKKESFYHYFYISNQVLNDKRFFYY